MATFPVHGQDPWDDDLKAYIDDTDTDVGDAAAAALAAHKADTAGAHAASAISNSPTPPFVGDTTQEVIDELVPLTALASPGTSGTPLALAGRGAATSGTSETFLATFKVLANTVSVGQVIEITAILQSSSTGTLTPRIRIGTAGTTADSTVNVSGVSAAGAANSYVTVRCFVYIAATGASSTMAAAIQGVSTAAAFTNATGAESLGNVVTTSDFYITFSATASVAGYTVRSIRCKKIG